MKNNLHILLAVFLFAASFGTLSFAANNRPGGAAGQIQTNLNGSDFGAVTTGANGTVLTTTAGGYGFFAPAGGAPSGAAGGDLGGTYPNPNVVNLKDVTTGINNSLGGAGGANSPVFKNSSGGLSALSTSGPNSAVDQKFTAANMFYQISQGLYVDPRAFGATCNALYADGRTYVPFALGQVSMTSGSSVISISGYTFSSADVGKSIAVNAGTAGDAGVATGTILSVNTGANTATLSVTPTVTTTGGYAVFGTDDTTGFSNAFANANAGAYFHGGKVILPDACLVRELPVPAEAVTLEGQATETNGGGYQFLRPSLYILATGFSEDTTSYGVNIAEVTDHQALALSKFQIRGLAFPSPATTSGFTNETLACVGTDSGTAGRRAGVVLDYMSITNCFVGFGARANLAANTGHIFFESHFTEFSANGWGMHGGFSDGMEIGDVFSGNFGYGGAYWGGGGGFNTTAMRLSEVRFEENLIGMECDACTNNHLEGVEHQFNTGRDLVLNGQWYGWMQTGGFFEYNDGTTRTPIEFTGNGNFSHPTASFVNVLMSAGSHFVLNNTTTGTSNITVEFSKGLAYTDGFDNNLMPPSAVVDPAGQSFYGIRWEPANGPQYIAGTRNSDYSYNLNGALGLQTSSATAGTIFDAMNATTSANSSIGMPNHTTANRPATPVRNMFAINTTTSAPEFYGVTQWHSLVSTVTGAPAPGYTFNSTTTGGFDGIWTAPVGGTFTPSSTDTLTNKTYDTAGTGNVLKIAGTQITAISGNTAKVGTTSGVLTNGDCVSIDASGNLVDAGGICTTGGGGGTVAAGTAGQFGVYATTGSTITGSTLATLTTGGIQLAGLNAISLPDNKLDVTSIAVGPGALAAFATTTGNNTAVGLNALNAATTGNNNTAIGASALSLNVTDNAMTAVGAGALQNAAIGNSTTGGNTAIGYHALQLNTTAVNNTALGYNALAVNVVTGNTGIGYNALVLSTTAIANVAVGRNALAVLTGGTGGNTAIGERAGETLTTGNQNVLIGKEAGSGMTTGVHNICIGYESCQNVTTGTQMILIGDQNHGGTTTAQDDIIIGRSSGGSMSGNGNVSLGNSNLQSLSSGGSNTVVGNNTATHITTGSSNIIIGTATANTTLQTGSSNILIGNSLDTTTSSIGNSINIGGLYKGDKSANLHVYYGGSAPALSSCGGSPTIDANATDTSGTVTAGSAATACTITFAHAFTSFNHCRVTFESALTAPSYSYNLTAITLAATALSGNVDYTCDGL